MAGRGRGVKTGTLTQEQLQTLGCVGKDMPQVAQAPPPTYPPLMSKPVTLETTASQNYQILWKEDFLNHMRDSAYFLQPIEKSIAGRGVSRYNPKQTNADQCIKLKPRTEFNWSLMPAELQMANKKRKIVPKEAAVKLKKTKPGNIEDRLKVLEEKEQTEDDVDAPNKTNSDSEEDVEEEVGEDVDDEMDDDNDYGNAYFDNGEAYNEEDDNLDDGPVY
ncbi:DNA-directed RNA polymerase III subunit RPC7-like [Musca domestica]|uniref:DNA-directed RNA polymerase III subunit RPC7-like n=1 Tax=Musca domestica TaxID=7370 RepID=A0A1I8MW35_MUSDO|nr:DNA-directed RNA polymerase III subunit RPC7-like [Musca domestica]XP_058981976.1 DNA-directed RNA polymerase III subunit RPC7-like [Musca domestica]XP_058981994.1 DNA-directed RNA polymerase III subunit RPC7-like [Musca domestica]